MGDETRDREAIKDYLLGDLAESEMQAVEERMMTDDEFSDLALMVESILVDDYIEGRMEARDRERFERLFLSTPQGREQVNFTLALKEYAAKTRQPESAEDRASPWRAVFSAPQWRFAAAAILLIAAGIGIWRAFFFTSEIDRGLAALNQAYRERSLDVRITQIAYAPRSSTRGDGEEEVDYLSLRRAERILRDQVEENPGSASFHAFGRFLLTRKDFDQAIAHFQKAIQLDPGNARLHNDMGAARLEKGKALEKEAEGRGAEEFSQSLEHLDMAIALDRNLLDALFNRALLYQQMSRFADARDAWEEYLRKDATSPWADEARKRIKDIEDQKKISSLSEGV